MSAHKHRRRAIQRFFRSPKGLLTIVFAILLAVAVPAEGPRLVAPGLLGAIAAGALLDLIILRIRNGGWEYPSGAILTGVIVAMVLSPHEPWHVAAVTSALAIASKYVFRTRSANVFNPAAFALVVTFYVFGAGHSWWGAMPEASPYAIVLLFAAGLFITDRVNKMPLVLVFVGVYFLLFTASAFVADPAKVAEVYRAPDLHMALYFAFFILTDPPTSPVKYRDQVVCAVIVAIVCFGVFESVHSAYYLLAGALVGNVWEAWRRSRKRSSTAKDTKSTKVVGKELPA